MSKNEVVIIGYSGHAYVVIEALLLSDFIVTGYFERTRLDRNPYNLEYLGDETNLDPQFETKSLAVLPAVGNNLKRGNIFLMNEKKFNCFVTAIHPQSNVSSFASIGNGTVILRGACVNPFAKIGDGVILNTGSIVEHECNVEDFAHIAPGAVLAGNVSVGKYSFIGANAVIKEGVKIGRNTIVGAGAVVLRNVDDYQTVVGNPAKLIIK